jgi:hypothetical protein
MSGGFVRLPTSLNPTRTDHERVHLDPLCEAETPLYGLDVTTQTAHEKTWATAADASLAAGGSRLGRYHIRGQQDFETVEIWRFRSAEAAFEHWSALTAAAYGEFNAFANNIGLAIEGSP